MENAVLMPIQLSELDINENDIFMPLVWLFEDTIVEDFITKVLRSNPFCCTRPSNRNSYHMNELHLSRRRISSNKFMR